MGKVREPVFLVTKNIALFSSPTGLSSKYFAFINKSNNKEITKNVYIQEIAFWNKGNLPIKAENILDPLIIVFNSEAEVIDTFISESKRPEIVNGKINLNSAENKINIQFDILKKNE